MQTISLEEEDEKKDEEDEDKVVFEDEEEIPNSDTLSQSTDAT